MLITKCRILLVGGCTYNIIIQLAVCRWFNRTISIITCNSITDNSTMQFQSSDFNHTISIMQIHSCNLNHTTQDFNYTTCNFYMSINYFNQSIAMCGLSDDFRYCWSYDLKFLLGVPPRITQITSILPKLMQSKERLGLHTLYIKLQVIVIVVPELWMSYSEWAEDWFMFLS